MKVHKKAGGDAKAGRIKGAAAGELADEELDCRDCSAKFVFTVGEQEFYKEKGFDNKPVRGGPAGLGFGGIARSPAAQG